MSPRPRCYVSIPFGRKRAADGELVDFDAVYREVIRPGVEEAGVECVRGDDLVSGEPIHAAVLRAVLGSEVVIADLTTRNPNVLYELGIRHGLVPSGTILLLAENEMLPFNLNMLWTLRYPLFEGMVPEDRRPYVQGLVRDAVIRCIEQRSEDSPVYYFFPHLRAELRELHLSPATAGGLRARPILRREERRPDQRELLEQLHRAHSGGSVAAFYGRHRATLRELGASDLETAIEIAKVLRLADAWDELLDFIAGLPGALRESRTLVHEHAMALSRRGRGDDLDQAVAAVTALLAREPRDAEALGILGRLERERFEAGGRPEALAAAIEAYREAFRLQPTNTHAGIEVLTLMSRAGAGEPEEGRELRAAVRRALESKNADYPEEAWDLWDLATAVELAVLGREWDEARRLAQLVAGKITEAWQAHSITQRIVRLVDPRAPGKGARAARLEPIVRIIRGRSDAVQ